MDKKEKNSHIFKYIILVLIFLVLGVAIGIYGTTRYLEQKDDSNSESENVEPNGPENITDKDDYKEIVNTLYATVKGKAMFYSSKGVSIDSVDNATKLTLIYNTLIEKKVGNPETIPSTFIGSLFCANDFVIDVGADPLVTSNICTVTKIEKKMFVETNKSLFGESSLDTNANFSPEDGKKCISDGDNYICGNVQKTSDVTGTLESRFNITKATRNSDGTIEIYDKGYLIDKRSNVANPDDGYDNYYLHSSDSNQYYYELRSADNLTFKHTFKKDENGNYYYVSTSLENNS